MLANCHRDKKKKASPYKPQDFMIRRKVLPKKAQSPEEMLEVIKGLNKMLGGSEV